jgi:uncharacterized protein (DUF4415 family)
MKLTSTTVMPDTSDEAPRLTQADFDRAKFKVSGLEASKSEWQSAVRTKTGKLRINIMLDAPIIEHFKALAGERGYQTLINDTLRRAVAGERLEADLRAIIREELHTA